MIDIYRSNKQYYINLFTYNKNIYNFNQKGGYDIDIDNLNIIKPIGTGYYGNVYMVQSKVLPNHTYALKVEYLLKSDKMQDLESKLCRNLKFDQDIGSLYPNIFLNILGYDVKDNCQEHKTIKQKSIELKYNESKSAKCLRIVYKLMDGTLSSEIINKMSDSEIKSMIMQLIYAIYLMHCKEYVHCDIFPKNIGYINTNETEMTIIINNTQYHIPIFSKRFVIMDYGNVLHPDFIMSKYEKDKYNRYKDLLELDSIFFGHMILNNYKTPKTQDIEEIHNKLKLSADYISINQITIDPLHQIIYNDIINNKFLENQTITDLAILYIKLGRNPEKLIMYILKSL